jgi:hypothetical protein
MPIDAINLDLASIDYLDGRASLWATLEVRSSATNGGRSAVLGFDETFLRPFTRTLIEAVTSGNPCRLTVRLKSGELQRQRVVEYVTSPGTTLHEIVLTPRDTVVVVSGRAQGDDHEEMLFQLPRSDSFLRAFVNMALHADTALRETLAESEKRLAFFSKESRHLKA